MEIGEINPHIRYACAHYNTFWGNILSYCYDCRLFYFKKGSGSVLLNGEKYNYADNTILYLPGGSEYEFKPDAAESDTAILIFDFDLVRDYAHIRESLGTADRTTFSPDNNCTRAQVVTFLYRFIGGR